ncbi:MAG: hypothetical protein JNM94_07530 [Phycisphaerae bacterium]|nr:hypothetical protein [Phycisphaerae bacterium]
MTNGQRAYWTIVLAAAATMLHLLLCRWGPASVQLGDVPPSAPLITFWTTHDRSTGRNWTCHGLQAQYWVSRGDAAVFGVAIPFLLVATDVYLLAGWRARARRASGRCARCGYDMTSLLAGSPCPECGAPTVSPR